MNKVPKILAIGKTVQDVFLTSDEFDPHTEGKQVYTHLPLGLKLEVEQVTFDTGGNAGNVATTFARQGLEVDYMWTLGSDPASETIMRVKVMLTPAGPELAEPDKLKTILEDVEILCVNKEEMQKLVHGETLEELVRHGLNMVPVVIVSDGPNGVCASDGKTIVTAGMYEDVKVVDRTGAGDAFASGFLSQWAVGKSLKDSIIFASANSTSVVTQIGAKTGILHQGVQLHDMPLEEKAL